ncbi:MAG: STAS-like domain-containing protein [Ignavibacteriaceae bacterium]|nr:STAS-like domain-containing protein [Ignavibacteriaceae bacterium]
MEYIINIKKVCGKNIVTRDDGKKVRDLIELQWTLIDKIKIDFGNVLVASVSFFDEIFGRLALKYSRSELTEKIIMENIQEYDRALLNDILRSRFRQQELKFQRQN